MNTVRARKVIVGYLQSEASQPQPERFHDATNDITERDRAMRRYDDYKKRMMHNSFRAPIESEPDVVSFIKGIGVFMLIFAIVFIATYLVIKAEGF